MLHDPPSAEDAVQEAAIKAWRKQHRLRPGTDLRPWFLGIVANECREHRRRRWTSVLRWAEVPAAAAALGVDLDASADLRRQLIRLTEADRLVVVLHFHLDMTLEEIAAVTRRSVGSVGGRPYRAIKKFRPGLELEEALR